MFRVWGVAFSYVVVCLRDGPSIAVVNAREEPRVPAAHGACNE